MKKPYLGLLSGLFLTTLAGCTSYEDAIQAYDKKDYSQALKYFTELAAEKEVNPKVMGYLGDIYDQGLGTQADFFKSVQYYQKGHELGDIHSTCQLGKAHLDGKGAPQDSKKAIELLVIAADKGDVVCQRLTGDAYSEGKNVAKDYAKAVEYYIKADQQNDYTSTQNLALSYFNGNGVKQNHEIAQSLFLKAWNGDNSLVDSAYYLGLMYNSGMGVSKDIQKSILYYSESAKLGDSDSMVGLGNIYFTGDELNSLKADKLKAFELFKQAAEKNDMVAINNIAIMLRDGEGVEQNYSEAIRWLNIAIERNDALAMATMSDIYAHREAYKEKLEKENLNEKPEIIYGKINKVFPGLSNANLANDYLVRSARLGYSTAQKKVGSDFLSRGMTDEALPIIDAYLSKNDDVDMLLWLAELFRPYSLGYDDFEQKDINKATKYLERAGSLGSAEAFSKLGLIFDQGLGVKKDHARANVYYLKSLEADPKSCGVMIGLTNFYSHPQLGSKEKMEEFSKKFEELGCDPDIEY